MTIELLPCPFCGDNDIGVSGFDAHCYAYCRKCGTEGPLCDFTEDQAIAAWNARQHSAEIQSALADQRRLREAATGECVEVGMMSDIQGGSFRGYLIQSTVDQMRRGDPVVYRRVAIVPLDQEGE